MTPMDMQQVSKLKKVGLACALACMAVTASANDRDQAKRIHDRIAGVPPGEYDVVVWTDGEERDKKRVRVAPGGTVELDFVVEPGGP